MNKPNYQTQRVHNVQMPIAANFTDQVDQLMAKMETLQAEVNSLREENTRLQQGNSLQIVTDEDGNILADQSDAGWEQYFPEASWHHRETDYD
jgi:hypothetical protein